MSDRNPSRRDFLRRTAQAAVVFAVVPVAESVGELPKIAQRLDGESAVDIFPRQLDAGEQLPLSVSDHQLARIIEAFCIPPDYFLNGICLGPRP